MNSDQLLYKVLDGGRLGETEALFLYENMPVIELADAAHRVRLSVKDPRVVTWQIDRNVNITNVCISGCKFCNFHCKPHEHEKSFVTTLDEYEIKIRETIEKGGDQLLLQGGLHPKLDISYYERLFRELKSRFPQIRLHALGAPEVWHIARISGLEVEETLVRLIRAGLDSLPGAGAEILTDGVRKRISPGKPGIAAWLETMKTAHRLGLATSATMMYGHVETAADCIKHLISIHDLQDECPRGNYGFLAFIPWIFHSKGTRLEEEGVGDTFSPLGYLKLIAVSRLVLNNIPNIQASWLTVGKETAQMALHSGANDMGSIMIEENVVSSAGASNRLDADGIRKAIAEAGFIPRLRDQKYNYRDESFLYPSE